MLCIAAHPVQCAGTMASGPISRSASIVWWADWASRTRSAGTVALETEQLDLVRLVEEFVSDVAAFVLPERIVRVSGTGLVPAVVDRASIAEIVFNLLANAHKYSAAEAGIEVDVEPDEWHARVVVRDEGSGVAPGDTEAIFEPYRPAQGVAASVSGCTSPVGWHVHTVVSCRSGQPRTWAASSCSSCRLMPRAPGIQRACNDRAG